MKVCEWCGKEFHRSNFKKHLLKCIYKNDLKETKINILNILSGKPLKTEAEIQNIELTEFLKTFYQKSKDLYDRTSGGIDEKVEEKIKTSLISEVSKQQYISEWKAYDNWRKKNHHNISVDSVAKYLGSIECKVSTKTKKRNILQRIFQTIMERPVRLPKIRMRYSTMPKYAMNTEELNNYLNEQLSIDYEDYLIQFLLAYYGLRVSNCSSLQYKHLEFLNGDDLIFFPDPKTNSIRQETTTNEINDKIKEYLKGKEEDLEPEDYVFNCGNGTLKQRACRLSARINKRIRESKVLKMSKNYKYSSHMFRKTKAFTMYQQGMKELKERARAAIGQQKNSNAVEYYIN